MSIAILCLAKSGMTRLFEGRDDAPEVISVRDRREYQMYERIGTESMCELNFGAVWVAFYREV